MGDVDGDGAPDVVVGAPQADLAKVFSGATGLSIATLSGPSGSVAFGRTVAGAGDVDGDGVPDVVVGDPFFPNLSGAATVFSGATAVPLPGLSLVGGFLQLFGSSVAGLGDVSGDGVPDVIVGAPVYPFATSQLGQARVYSGAIGSVLHTLSGSAFGDFFGAAVSGIGDVNGDGVRDLLVGAPRASVGGVSTAGRVTFYSGSSGALLPGLTFEGGQMSTLLGTSAAAAGDVDGDGVPDAILGGPECCFLGSGPGVAMVVSAVGIPPGSSPFGSGCPGSSGEVPRIRTGGGSPSVASGNANFRLVITNSLPSAPAHLVLGVSNALWIAAGIPLPVDLAFLGLPGCPLLVSLDFLFFATTTGDGIASVPVPVPAVPALVGLPVYFQGRVFDSLGAVTEGLELVL